MSLGRRSFFARREWIIIPLLLATAAVYYFTTGNGSNDGTQAADDGAQVADVAVADDAATEAEVDLEVEGEVEGAEPDPAAGEAAPVTSTSTTTTQPPESLESSFAPVGEVEFISTLRDLQDANVVEQFEDAPTFDRASYVEDGWPDLDGDCQSVRHEVLIEESVIETVLDDEGCRVELGLWADPYAGAVYNEPSDVAVDRVVPLEHAHRAGAWEWDADSKRSFAADVSFPAALVVVGSEVNQDKGDSGPARWRPPLEDAWCRYAVDWTAVKVRWDLSFTEAELDALVQMLATCGPEEAASDAQPTESASPATTVAAPTETEAEPAAAPDETAEPEEPAEPEPEPAAEPEEATTTTAAEPEPEPEPVADIRIAWCRVITEVVQLRNAGAQEVTLSGWTLHDMGREHEFDLSDITLEPGGRVVLLSGEDTSDAPGQVRWISSNVWDTGRDVATLRNPAGDAVATEECDQQRG